MSHAARERCRETRTGWPGATRSRPAHRAADAEAATRAMTVLHATEPATVYLSLWARVDGADRRRRRPRPVRRPHPGQAARHAAHPVRLPARPAAGGVGERVGPGGRRAPRARLAKDVETAGARHRRRGLGRRGPSAAVLARLAGRPRAVRAASSATQVPELAVGSSVAGQVLGANVPIAPRVLTQLGVEGRARARPQRRPLAAPPGRGGPLMADWLGDDRPSR